MQRSVSGVSVLASADWGDTAFRGCTPMRKLGSGAQGEVYLLVTVDGRQAVDKKVCVDRLCSDSDRSTIGATVPDEELRERAEKEVRLLHSLKHRHVVHLFDAWIEPDLSALHIIEEYCGGGTLESVIESAFRRRRDERQSSPSRRKSSLLSFGRPPGSLKDPGGTHAAASPPVGADQAELTEPRVCAYLHQLARALAHVHEHRVVHRDVKPANIFLSSDRGSVKLGDFGESTALSVAVRKAPRSRRPPPRLIRSASRKLRLKARTNTPEDARKMSVTGTPLYMAPEVIGADAVGAAAYDYAADIFSLGCVAHEMLALSPPYLASSLPRLLEMIRAQTVTGDSLPAHVSPELRGVIAKMLLVSPPERPTARELRKMEVLSSANKARTDADDTESGVAFRGTSQYSSASVVVRDSGHSASAREAPVLAASDSTHVVVPEVQQLVCWLPPPSPGVT